MVKGHRHYFVQIGLKDEEFGIGVLINGGGNNSECGFNEMGYMK